MQFLFAGEVIAPTKAYKMSSSDGEIYIVEKILDKRIRHGTVNENACLHHCGC